MTGAGLIAVERVRQISEESWTPEHDDQHKIAELTAAALAYASAAQDQVTVITDGLVLANVALERSMDIFWPYEWGEEAWKPSPDPIRNLVKAGALIAAEIDRLQRKKEREEAK
jgi:hypothetical protein